MKTEYDVIEFRMYDEFVSEVNMRLKDGWQLHGNLIVFPHYEPEKLPEGGCYIQAVVREFSEPVQDGEISVM